jgi:hypothetical protein
LSLVERERWGYGEERDEVGKEVGCMGASRHTVCIAKNNNALHAKRKKEHFHQEMKQYSLRPQPVL